jgi:hypothetical protein
MEETMTGAPEPPPGVDISRPSAARVYDYLLGGTDNYPPDQMAGEMIKARAPELSDSAHANRSYHRRVARWLAGQGIAQYIYIGSGLPTATNTHEIVRRVVPSARVVYVDHDPQVLALGSALLGSDPDAIVILADMRQPGDVLQHPQVRELIDFSQPAAVLLSSVLHFIPDETDPYGLIRRYRDALAPGSYLSVSHMTGENKPPQAVAALQALGQSAAEGAFLRDRDAVRGFFDGMEIVPPYPGADPDVTWVGLWDCEDPAEADTEDSRWLYCGVGKVLASEPDEDGD